MKALLVLVLLATLVLIGVSYRKHRDIKKLFLSLGLFGVLIGLGIAGGVMRAIVPLYLAHIVAIIVAWGALVWYVLGGRFYWYTYLLPVLTVALFWVLEYTEGSRHEALGKAITRFLA